MCLSCLFTSRIFLAWAARDGLMCSSRSVKSLCAGTFADTKSSGSLPYGSIMFYDIMCHLYDPLFDGALLIRICFHTPLPILCLYIVCRRGAFYLLLGDFYLFNLAPLSIHLLCSVFDVSTNTDIVYLFLL